MTTIARHNTNYSIIEESYNESYYISVNSFKSRRKMEQLQELLYFYVDLDITECKYHKTVDHEKMSCFDFNKQQKLYNKLYLLKIFEICKTNNLPKPSIINNSGNGYHIYWKIESFGTPDYFDKYYGASFELSKPYTLILKELVKVFKVLGADSKCTDVTRLLRQTGTYNPKSFSTCETIYRSDTIVLFKEMADSVFKYQYEDVVEYKKITPVQVKFIKDKKLANDSEITKLDKFSAKELIKQYINTNTPATKKQLEVLNKFEIEHADNITKKEADALIKKSKYKISYKHDYIYKILSDALVYGDIKPGNRSYFFYYLGIACKRIELCIEETVIEATKVNKIIKFDTDEMIYHLKQGHCKTDKYLNIKKATIFEHLKLEPSKYVQNTKKSRKRANKSKIQDSYKCFCSNIQKYIKLGVRKAAIELGVSKSTIANYIKRRKKELEEHKEKNKTNKLINDTFLEQLTVINTLNLDLIELEKDCPYNHKNMDKTRLGSVFDRK